MLLLDRSLRAKRFQVQKKKTPQRFRQIATVLLIGGAIGVGAGYWLTKSSETSALSTPTETTSVPAVVAEVAQVPTDPEGIIASVRLGRVPVIMYHDVVEKKQVWFDTTEGEFREQLDSIRESGATPISIQQLYDHLHAGAALPPKPILLTFDDGYLGHFEYAYPLLKEYNYPAVFFVHTAYIGVKTSKEHMSWEQLETIDKEGLVAIQSHTVNHPDDLRLSSDTSLQDEMIKSKALLEERLGHPILYLAYPTGNQDERVRRAAIDAGYLMSFTMDLGYAEQSPSMLAVQRFIDTRLGLALSVMGATPDTTVHLDAPITKHEATYGPAHLVWVSGGTLSTNHANGRFPVGTFVKEASATAGVNGGFFAMKALHTDNSDMVGPYLAKNEGVYTPGNPDFDKSLRGRPVVLISPTGIRFVPYSPETFSSLEAAQLYLSDLTDMFVAGIWLVNDSKALTTKQITQFKLSNHAEFRRRAFLAIDQKGLPVVGATLSNINATQLAKGLAAAGMREAVLLDSGFSTSLVYQGKILVTGHTEKSMPSRIVPHVILVHPSGALQTESTPQ
jgi:poly-beta-1,6-N-acetyl-D-glucosamine N-deacetylase